MIHFICIIQHNLKYCTMPDYKGYLTFLNFMASNNHISLTALTDVWVTALLEYHYFIHFLSMVLFNCSIYYLCGIANHSYQQMFKF